MMTGWEIDVAQAVFQGKSNKEIAIEVLHADPNDKARFRAQVTKIKNLLMTKKFEAYYKSMITEWTVHNVGRALNKLSEQIDHEKPWLANKAANDILQRVPKSLLADEDENTVVVKVEGMPTLGVPEE
jgi:hypothetical protein